MAEEYIGVKFKTLFEGVKFELWDERADIVREIDNLGSHRLLERNNGNISVKVEGGLVITPTGMDMSKVETRDMVLVTDFNDSDIVRVVGTSPPSSEARMHWMIYKAFPKVGAIVHFHDNRLFGKFSETSKEHPYGTLELAKDAIETLKKKNFIILKNHGPLVVGKDIKECHKLVEKAEKLVN